MGEQFTVADAYLFTVLSWGGFANLDIGKWPQLKRFVERVGARPHVIEALKAEGTRIERPTFVSRAAGRCRPFAVTIGSVQALHVRGRNGYQTQQAAEARD